MNRPGRSKKKALWMLLAILATPVLIVNIGLRVLTSDSVRCANVGWFSDPPVEFGPLSFRVGPPVCIHWISDTLRIEASMIRFAEASVAETRDWGTFNISLYQRKGRFIGQTSPYDKDYQFVETVRTPSGGSFSLFEWQHEIVSRDKEGREQLESALRTKIIGTSDGGGLEMSASRSEYWRSQGYIHPYHYDARYQWDPSFYVRFSIWRHNDPLPEFAERTERVAAKVRAFISSVSQPRIEMGSLRSASAH